MDKIDLTLGGALGTDAIDLSKKPSDKKMAALDMPDSKELLELKDIIKDVLSGDPDAAKNEKYRYLNFNQIKTAIEWLMTNNFDEQLQSLLLTNPWLLTFKNKPPTAEEFLSHKYIGAMADSVWLPVRKMFIEYFDPMKPYRNAILNPSIGAGKQQPVSSPICVGEEDYIEIKKDDTILSFSLDDKIFANNKIMLARDLTESMNFPVSINYLIMMIYNVEKTGLFDDAFKINSYDKLISYFQTIDESIYNEWDIYVQKHHIIPKSEGGSDDKNNLVKLPYYFHLMAHYLRGKEAEKCNNKKAMYSNYRAVIYALNENSIPKDVVEAHSKFSIIVESLEKTRALERKRIWVTNDAETKRVFDFELDDYKKLGWHQGRKFKNPETKRWMNKNGKNFYVEKDDVENKLKDGYSLGMFKTEKMIAAVKEGRTVSYSTLNTKWMNKDGKRKAVKIEDVQKYLDDGWALGSASQTCKGKHWKWSHGYHWYNNGEKSILAKSCPEGFTEGRICK